MAAPAPSPPIWVIALGIVGWVAFTFAAVAAKSGFWIPGGSDQEEILFTVTGDALAVLASAFAALALGGGLLGIWQVQDWRRRTQTRRFDELELSMGRVANVVAEIRTNYTVIDDAAFLDPTISDMFSLPLSEPKLAAIQAHTKRWTLDAVGKAISLMEEPASPLSSRRSVQDLLERADELRASVRDLTEYLDHEEAQRVEESSSNVRSVIRKAIGGGENDDALTSVTVAIGVPGILDAVLETGVAIDGAFDSAARRVSAKRRSEVTVRRRLQDLYERSTEAEDRIEEAQRESEEFRTFLADADRAVASFAATQEEVTNAVRDLMNQPGITPEDLREIRLALDGVAETLNSMKRTSPDDVTPPTEQGVADPVDRPEGDELPQRGENESDRRR